MMNVIRPNRMVAKAFGDYKIIMIIEIIFSKLSETLQITRRYSLIRKKELFAGNPFSTMFHRIQLICLQHMVCWPFLFGLLKCIYGIIIIFIEKHIEYVK